jgi:YidC/Oxa1 family membrane protein insertase
VDKRLTTYMILVAAIYLVSQLIFTFVIPPPPAPKNARPAAAAKPAPKKADKEPAAAPEKGAAADNEAAKDEATQDDAAKNDAKPTAGARATYAPPAARARATLGSAEFGSPYRMLVTWTNRGAAVERIELNSPRYHELEDRSGYLGHLAPGDAPQKAGAVVNVVGMGTPAERAGLKVGDVITAVGDKKIVSAESLLAALKDSKPNEKIQIALDRAGARQQLTAELKRQPIEVVRPEFETKPVETPEPGNHDPLSFLLTIQQLDDRTLGTDDKELGGVELRDATWEVVAATQDSVSFRRSLGKLGLQVTKTYRLAKVPKGNVDDPDYPAYSLNLDISIANTGKVEHEVAYRLGGPTGLPIEGAWYATKVSRNWGAAGMRDVIVHFDGAATEQISCNEIADPLFKRTFINRPLDYIAVDGIYFSAAIMPQTTNPDDVLFAEVKPVRVGEVPDKSNLRLTDISFRLDSVSAKLTPGGPPLVHQLQVFTGPKRPALLSGYGSPVSLRDLVYYGWFGIVAQPMLLILHFFYHLVGNYGLAIIMLTVLVRGCMFPLSRKQALNAAKMQELQPEIKRLHEKYKNDTEKKTKAQQDLFRQHNYNPLSGCMPALVQLPIFIGLYRSLMVDIELRQAALFGEGIRWASNLAAPDMLWDWTAYMPAMVTHGTGFLALGPYLNIFPLITVGLYIWQQNSFMPPPADEQAALQQKMMKYMTILVGIMFYRVASGLCIYLIVSSAWGMCERKLLPTAAPKNHPAGTTAAVSTASSGNGAAVNKKRQRGRK